jgi:hypothetical protein
MENVKVVVTIFYSNYSGNCKALLQRIKNSNLMDKLTLKFINIDNDTIKSIIIRKFSVVPAIVVMIEDEISLYTGDNVFEWFNIFSSSFVGQKQPTQSISLEKPQDSLQQSKETTSSSKKNILDIAAEISKAREKM